MQCYYIFAEVCMIVLPNTCALVAGEISDWFVVVSLLSERCVSFQALQAQSTKCSELEHRNTELTTKCEEASKTNDHVRKLNAELLRRCEDTSRAYDQERKEHMKSKTNCDSLQESVKVSSPLLYGKTVVTTAPYEHILVSLSFSWLAVVWFS